MSSSWSISALYSKAFQQHEAYRSSLNYGFKWEPISLFLHSKRLPIHYWFWKEFIKYAVEFVCIYCIRRHQQNSNIELVSSLLGQAGADCWGSTTWSSAVGFVRDLLIEVTAEMSWIIVQDKGQYAQIKELFSWKLFFFKSWFHIWLRSFFLLLPPNLGSSSLVLVRSVFKWRNIETFLLGEEAFGEGHFGGHRGIPELEW